MDTLDTLDTLGEKGNTSTFPPIRSRGWCFTLNNYEQNDIDTLTLHFEGCEYIIGKEVGENGTPHLQGYVWFKSARSFKAMKKMIPNAHLEKAKGHKKSNYNYCSKGGDFISTIILPKSKVDKKLEFRNKLKEKVLLKYKDIMWKPWQQKIIDIIEAKPDERVIHWFHESQGNVGKSFLAKYIACKYDIILMEGKKNDIFNQVNDCLDRLVEPKIVVVDIPRCSKEFVSYSALEQLKNGMLYSGKYEGGMCIFDTPTVIVLSNDLPDYEKMSMDRWDVIEIID